MDDRRTDWHALTVDEVYQQQHTHSSGLSESESTARLTKYGPNELPRPASRSLLARLWEQFNNLLIYVLLIAAMVSLLMGHWIDSALIAAVVIINAVIGLIQEGKAENALESIRGLIDPKRSSSETVKPTPSIQCFGPW
jgi:Cation transport ATPase